MLARGQIVFPHRYCHILAVKLHHFIEHAMKSGAPELIALCLLKCTDYNGAQYP